MTDWNDLSEQLKLRLTSAATSTAALRLATLAEALADELARADATDQDGISALRALALAIRTPTTLHVSGQVGHA